MSPLPEPQNRSQPEVLLRRLAAQLGRHALWDALLAFVPPALALIYIVAYLNRAAWFGSSTLIVLAVAIVGLSALAVIFWYRPLIPGMAAAARMIDQRFQAMDRFLTLATIDAGKLPTSLIARLRAEAAGFGERIALKQDFPYKPKRLACWSVGGSLVAALLFHLFFPLAAPALHPAVVTRERLLELAEQMGPKPGLSELAKDLKNLAMKLEDARISQKEKTELIQEIEKKIQEQQKKEQDKDKRDLLAQAASEAKGLEKQEPASGQDGQKAEQKGGGIESNLSQEGEGQKKPSQGSGEGKNDSNTAPSQDNQQGKSAQGNPQEPGPEKSRQQGDAKTDRPDPNQPGKEPSQERIAKSADGSKEGSGKNRGSEEPPQGTPPSERYYKPGEGNEGIRGARYVTVQLPEALAADSRGETAPSKPSKGTRARSQVPVSNVPLPSHVPDAPTEKQQMPIEYRGVIR